MAEIVYPCVCSSRSCVLRYKMQKSRTRAWHRRICLASFPFCVALDNRVIAAQKARGYSEAETLRALGQRALEQKRRYGCVRRWSSTENTEVRESPRCKPF